MKKIVIVIVLTCYYANLVAQPSVNYNDVAVIINTNSQTSINIGNYFVQQRNIPAQNVINISTVTNEEIDSLEFQNIRMQIESYLTTNNLEDSINYIVTTKGVPLKVERSLFCDSTISIGKCSSLDSDLALILGNDSNAVGAYGGRLNPYYNSSVHFSRAAYSIYLVTRLDGYTEADVINLIDRSGPNTPVNKLSTQFIFDISHCDSSTLSYFQSMAQFAYDSLISDGWNATLHPDTSVLTNQQNVFGYFSVDYQPANTVLNNTWVKGSIAELLFIFTANTFDSATNINNDLLVADLISEGVTGANGYAYYTYASTSLNVSHILFNRYTDTASHYNLAECYYMAMIMLSDQHIVIGDPKSSIIIDNTTSIENPGLFQEVMISPNPFTSILSISIQNKGLKQTKITIKNVHGQTVFIDQDNNISNSFIKTIDLGFLPNGIYLLDINIDEERTVKKIVKG